MLLSNLTKEEKALRQARNKEHYIRYKNQKNKKSIHDMTEEQKEKQRNIWRNSTRRCRQKKKDPAVNSKSRLKSNDGDDDYSFLNYLNSRCKHRLLMN